MNSSQRTDEGMRRLGSSNRSIMGTGRRFRGLRHLVLNAFLVVLFIFCASVIDDDALGGLRAAQGKSSQAGTMDPVALSRSQRQ